tara:strand:- start:118 stop:498 length:381 start_codon:yes stop_codon:yes gene_type:complete
MSIEIKSDLDYLDQLAADSIAEGREEIAKDFRAAALDIKNLSEEAKRREERNEELIERLNTLEGNAGVVLINELEKMIDRKISERLEINGSTDDHVERILRELINGGDVCVDVDYTNLELELTLSC